MDGRPGQQHLYIVKDPLNHDTRKYGNLDNHALRRSIATILVTFVLSLPI